MRRFALAPLLLVAVILAGCPDRRATRDKAQGAPCERFGQSCEVSPGKLGTCVLLDDCKAPSCFACQSQH